MTDLEHTITLDKLGIVGKVKVYTQAYVDKLEKRIEELENENARLKKTVEHYRKQREFFIGEVEK